MHARMLRMFVLQLVLFAFQFALFIVVLETAG
jgi:hypothetical protein